MSKSRLSRRDFMRRTAAAAGAGLASKTILLDPGPAYGAGAAVPPSDTLRFGIIGIGMQGSGLLHGAITHPGVECVAACDLYDGRHVLAQEIVGKPITVTRRYQDLLENKEIDCIINATPDHWHKQIVVDCCNAGKDVYSEKPMTHKVSEGFEMIAAAQKNNRIVQIGSQRASSIVYAKAKELIEHGAIGEVHTVEGAMGRNSPNGAWQYPPPPDLSPQNLDWDTWLGTAPKIPFNPLRFARWRCWQDYGCGVAGDLMVHLLTGIHYVGGVTQPPERALATGGIFRFKDGRDFPDVHHVLYDYPQFPVIIKLMLTCDFPETTKFYGTGGLLEIAGEALTLTTQDGTDHDPGWYYLSFPKAMREEYAKKWHIENDPRLAKSGTETIGFRPPTGYSEDWAHMHNFLEAVRTRKPVIEDTVFGNNTAIACHMANASYFQKRIVQWDGIAKEIRA
ncbi:MAG: Gfo/Idh/MocA family protein [Terriglobia bacterium]